MTSSLSDNNLLPLQAPYTALGLHDESEMTTTQVLSSFPFVDWVLVELRDRNNPEIIIETAVGLLLSNGYVLNHEGTFGLSFEAVPNPYFVSIRHRNHIGVRTLDAIDLRGTNLSLDFRTLPLDGGSNITNIVNGYQTLWAGDASNDGSINAADRSATWNQRNQSGYLNADVNLDGTTNAADRSITWNNRNKGGL